MITKNNEHEKQISVTKRKNRTLKIIENKKHQKNNQKQKEQQQNLITMKNNLKTEN